VLHFQKRELFGQLVPTPLAKYEREVDLGTEALMAASGVCFLVPGLHRVARRLTLGFLVPTFPAAFAQARHPEKTRELGIPTALVVARIPAQAAMCAWIWWATRSP
jgi:uncharacterized membrane protein